MSVPQKPKPSLLLSIGWTPALQTTSPKSPDLGAREKSVEFSGNTVSLSPAPQRKLEALDLKTSVAFIEKSPHKELSRRKIHGQLFKSESAEELRPKAAISPPKHLYDNEYFELTRFLCGCLPANEISPQSFCRFAEQAIKDVKYMQAFAQKAILEQHKIPVGMKKTIIEKLRGLNKLYKTLIDDFETCKITFAYGETISAERTVLNLTDNTGRYLMLTSQTDMAMELKNRWKQLIRGMDQLRAKMPAPCDYCPDRVVPDISLAEFPERMSVNQRRKMENAHSKLQALQACIGQMEDNWKVLKTMISEGEVPPYVIANTDNFHVLLPNQVKPLPPSCDITQLATDEPRTLAERNVAASARRWVISSQSESSALESLRVLFPTKESAEEKKKELDEEDERKKNAAKKKKAEKKSEEELTLSVPAGKSVAILNPKPEDYFQFQPVLLDLLEQVQQRGQLLVSQAKQPLNDLIENVAEKKELTEDQYELFKQHYRTMYESIELWNTHFPSFQELYEHIYQEDSALKKGVRFVVAGAVKGIHKFQHAINPAKLVRRASDLTVRKEGSRLWKRRGSLQEISLPVGKPLFQMETVPPTPTPTPAPSPNGPESPRLPHSPEKGSKEDS